MRSKRGMRSGLAALCCAASVVGCSSLYKLNHLATKDQTEKDWTAVGNPAAGPAAQPAKATTPPATAQCKEGASAEELRECDRLKRSQDSAR
jgi:hypothetical protein